MFYILHIYIENGINQLLFIKLLLLGIVNVRVLTAFTNIYYIFVILNGLMVMHTFKIKKKLTQLFNKLIANF